MRLAAQYADLWNISFSNVAKYKERLDILKQHCDDLGRYISTLRLTWMGSMAIGKTENDAQQNAKEIEWGIDSAFVGTSETIATQMAQFIELGVDYFMLMIPSLPNPDIANLITQELLPKINAL